MKEAFHLAGSATQMLSQKFSDYGNPQLHIVQHQQMGTLRSMRDISHAPSTNGAQLMMKKHSNTWLLILIILNISPTSCYKTEHIIINLATPGPNSPGDIELFIQPIFEEMAVSSEGIWIWDSSYFVNHAQIVMALVNMLCSAKLIGIAGHSAIMGINLPWSEEHIPVLQRKQKLSIIQFHLPKIRSTIQIAHMTSQIFQSE